MAVNQLLYGPEHPYGHPGFGSPKSLQSFSRRHRRVLSPEDASGKGRADRRRRHDAGGVDRRSWRSRWAIGDRRSPASKTTFPPLTVPKPTTLYLIDKPGAAQSVVSVALPGTMRTSPDYFRLLVMNNVFGGQFFSRRT